MCELIRKICRRIFLLSIKITKDTIVYINKKTFRFALFFYSQQGEDKEIFEQYYKHKPKTNGIFVELGAMDGLTYSNTKFFEDTLKWRGILIEPIVANYEKLKKNRSGCLNYNCAVGLPEKALFVGDGATAGMLHTMSANFKRDWHPEAKKENYFEVACRPIAEIFHETGIETIDLLSVDVEGGELEVLATINWDKVNIHLILIELDGYEQEKDDACRNILIQHGFRFDRRIGNNDLWENPRFSNPAEAVMTRKHAVMAMPLK
jgi:FkbM family methyltransferase